MPFTINPLALQAFLLASPTLAAQLHEAGLDFDTFLKGAQISLNACVPEAPPEHETMLLLSYLHGRISAYVHGSSIPIINFFEQYSPIGQLYEYLVYLYHGATLFIPEGEENLIARKKFFANRNILHVLSAKNNLAETNQIISKIEPALLKQLLKAHDDFGLAPIDVLRLQQTNLIKLTPLLPVPSYTSNPTPNLTDNISLYRFCTKKNIKLVVDILCKNNANSYQIKQVFSKNGLVYKCYASPNIYLTMYTATTPLEQVQTLFFEIIASPTFKSMQFKMLVEKTYAQENHRDLLYWAMCLIIYFDCEFKYLDTIIKILVKSIDPSPRCPSPEELKDGIKIVAKTDSFGLKDEKIEAYLRRKTNESERSILGHWLTWETQKSGHQPAPLESTVNSHSSTSSETSPETVTSLFSNPSSELSSPTDSADSLLGKRTPGSSYSPTLWLPSPTHYDDHTSDSLHSVWNNDFN